MKKNNHIKITKIDVSLPEYLKNCYLSYDMLLAHYACGLIAPSYGDAYCVLTKRENKDKYGNIINTNYTYDDNSKIYVFTNNGFIEVGRVDNNKSHKYMICKKDHIPNVKTAHRDNKETLNFEKELQSIVPNISIEQLKEFLNMLFGSINSNSLDEGLMVLNSELPKKIKRKTPLIINIEGIDAIGKATTTSRLHSKLSELGYKGKIVSFPRYNSEFGVAVKKILMGACGDSSTLDPSLISPLYTLDRIEYFKSNLKDIENDYDYLICDRSFYSNFIYQGSKLNNGNQLHEWLMLQYKLEFENTKLDKYTYGRMKTYVLMLDNENNQKQLNSRESLDCNEKNYNYLATCRKVIDNFTNPEYVNTFKMFRSKSLRDGASVKYDLPYLTNVMPIKVMHADTPDKINEMVDKTVDTIIGDIFLMKLL